MTGVFTILSMISGVFLGRGIATGNVELIISGAVGIATAVVASSYISWKRYQSYDR